ncbi:MAG: hypothetical protein RL497_2997, partial [Pseudomonadota bacterium]
MQAPSFKFNKAQLLALAIASVTQALCSDAWAGPEGGQVVAGQGVIEQIEKETRIQQATERLSIDWKNFDVNSDERVKFIQPNSSSIAFNRILSNKGSLIQGQIDANGQVVLINPNGIIFTKGSTVNAGGLIASALQMTDQDYLNGKFTLNALEGTEGRVINSGLLNAATGGNISLIGQSVENNGLISANLGSVNLAAGKEAVLTFEPNGLIGVRVTQEVLQKDLGVDAAILNNGEIKAEGGKVLLTASTSKDIFSQAVNVGELKQAKSVVVHDDGSFTLGGGADVINTGTINVGAENKAGEAVVIGENITNQGIISADSQTASAGNIEITAKDKNETKDKGTVTAVAHTNGKGGDIKLLGDKVGLLDNAKIDASGANGGGQVLLGGDKTGSNSLIKNAQFLTVGEKTEVKVDAAQVGNGGKLIAFAEDTTRIYGALSVRGGIDGRGGFVETSGLKGFEIENAPDISSATYGLSGYWLIDPYDINISGIASTQTNISLSAGIYSPSDNAVLGWGAIASALDQDAGATVEVKTSPTPDAGGTIKISTNFDFSTQRNNSTEGFNSTLILTADKNIETTSAVTSIKASNNNRLNIELNAKEEIILGATKIETNGGNFTAKTTAVTATTSTTGNITSTGAGEIITRRRPADGGADFVINPFNNTQSGFINIEAIAGSVSLVNVSSAGYTPFVELEATPPPPANKSLEGQGGDAGTLIIKGKTGVTISGLVSSAGGTAKDNVANSANILAKTGGNANTLEIISAEGAINIATLSADGGKAGYDTVNTGNNERRSAATGGNAGDITLTAVKGAINLTGTASNTFGSGTKDLGFSGNGSNDKNGNGADFSIAAKNITTHTLETNAKTATFEATETVSLGNLKTQFDKNNCGDGLCSGDLLIKTATDDSGITLTQSAEWTIRGNTQLDLGAQGSATLTQMPSQFAGAGKKVSLTAKDVTLASNFSLLLNNVTVENLNLFSALDITQEAATKITVTGNTELTANTITLTNSENDFATINSLVATASAGIVDKNALIINALNTPDLSINTQGDAQFNGAITVGANNQTILQTGPGAIALGDNLSKSGSGNITFKTTASTPGAFKYTGNQTAAWDLNAKTLSANNTLFIYDGFTSLIGGTGNDVFNLSGALTPLPTLSGGASGTDELNINENNNAANNWGVTLVKSTLDFTPTQNGQVQATGLDKIQLQNVNASIAPQLTLNDSGATTWTLTSATTEFKLNNTNLGGDINFTGFKQLNGGAGADVFNYFTETANNTQHFIGSLKGGTAANTADEIKGLNTATTWDLSGTQQQFFTATAPAEKINFSEIETLTGSTTDTTTDTTTGTVNKDTVKLSSAIDEVNLSSSFSALTLSALTLNSMDVIQATSTNAKLIGYAASSSWEITGLNAGKITDTTNASNA